MPKIVHVKKAQQRYYSKPVIDPETGEQKQTPVMSQKTGQQKVTKRGKPVFMKVTVDDKDRPKPNLRCDYPGCEYPDREIKPGQSYKHITPKSGPFGGTQRNRHEEHPSWNVWEYSSSLSARIAEIESHWDPAQFDNEDDLKAHLEEIVEEIRGLAEEKEEAASNIEEGFGHSTSASEELSEQAEALNNWADEVENMDLPDFPESESRWFIKDPEGDPVGEEDGYAEEHEAGTDADTLAEENGWDPDDMEVYEDTPDEPSEDQISEWQDEVAGLDLGDPGV